MKAMIFAAGLGTRLYPITKDKPKALAPFLNMSLLAYNLRYLANSGINQFIINTHHFADKIEEYLKQNNNFGYNITLSYEEILLDTAGGLAKAAHLFDGNEDILLYNVDVISNIDIRRMYQFHKENKSMATLAIRNRDTSRYLLFNHENRLVGWQNISNGNEIWCDKKNDNVNQFAFSGIHWINSSLIEKLIIEKLSIVPFYLDKGKDNKIMGYEHNDNYWFDCGKIESLKAAEEYINQQQKK
ncbi:MAG: nucleotidyltransferase family protein [Bacteroidetes bacterium]|nr:MAG: nucleotidyltransferase family protein [Bacteroidota bacterium]